MNESTKDTVKTLSPSLFVTPNLHNKIPLTGYVNLILHITAVATASWVLWGYSEAMVIGAPVHVVAAEYT